MRLVAGALFVVATLTVASFSVAQPPEGGKGQPGKGKRPTFQRPDPAKVQIINPFVARRLELTEKQQAEIEKLQKETQAKFEKILTDDQKKMLKEMSNRRPGGGKGRPDREPLKVGDPAPPFELTDVNGKNPVSLSDLKGKPVVLVFGSCT